MSELFATCVFSCSGGKLGLSMRDVDQATGRDLLDLDKIRAAQVGTGVSARHSACSFSVSFVQQEGHEDTGILLLGVSVALCVQHVGTDTAVHVHVCQPHGMWIRKTLWHVDTQDLVESMVTVFCFDG